MRRSCYYNHFADLKAAGRFRGCYVLFLGMPLLLPALNKLLLFEPMGYEFQGTAIFGDHTPNTLNCSYLFGRVIHI